MKNNYDEILAKATAPDTSNRERSEIYRSNPGLADRLRQDVKLSNKIAQLQHTAPDAKTAFKTVLSNIPADELSSVRYAGVAETQTTVSRHSWATRLKVYLPMAALLVVIGLAGVVWFRNSQPTSSTDQPPVANGSISNANSAMIQDGTSEQTNAVSNDGTADIYAASANSLKNMGSSADANF